MSRTFLEKLELCSADLDARAHGGGDDAASDILTLCSGGLSLDDSVQQSLEVLLQLLCTEGNLANGAVDDVGLVETVLDLTSLDFLDSSGDVGSHSASLGGPEQAEKSMQTVYEQLNTPWGSEVMTPCYKEHYFDGALMKLFNPTTKENGGIFCQPQGWAILAESLMGHGGRAFEYFTESCPASYNDRAEVREIEPYVHGQFIEGHESPQPGRAHVHWLTGTASTVMVGCVEGILGLRPTPEGLVICPAIPAEWDGFTMDKTFRGKRLHITVDNAAHKEGNPSKVLVNGVEVAGVLTDDVLTDGCQITVVM